MAAIFQIRRGSGSVSLEDGELYVNKGPDSLQYAVGDREITLAKLDELNTGSLYLKGGISASGDITASNMYVSGNVVLGGTITIGDSTSDNVIFNADLSSSIIPDATNTYDLGSTSKVYKNVYATSISGAIAATNGVVSGSSQITYTSISSIPAGIVSSSAQVTPLLPTGVVSGSAQTILNLPTGTVSGSAQITYTSISSIPAGIVSGSAQVTPLLPTGVVSGSSQITYANISSIPASIVSGSSQITYTNISSIPAGIISGSAQVTPLLPTGVISGSSQLNNTSIENLTVINLTTVNETASVIFSSGSNRFGDFGDDTHDFTGSVKISGSITTIGSSTATSFNGTINANNGVVSGSTQITYASISSIPSGIVSGSTQVTPLLPTGTISGSIQVLGGTGIVSGSSQITYASISSIPSGIVSGSTQVITLLPTGTISGSIQVLGGTGIVSGSSQITYANISSTPAGIVSGSTQVITLLPAGVVSSSIQIIENLPTDTISGSAQITTLGFVSSSVTASSLVTASVNVNILTFTKGNGSTFDLTIAASGSAPAGTISGSAQITSFGFISSSSIPAGTISGSSQIIANLPTGVVSGSSQLGNYVAAISGTSNQVLVAGSGVNNAVITLTTPQDIASTSNVQFNSIGVGTAASTVAGELRATGDITAFYSSDVRLKENIQPIENALLKVESISGNTYDWKVGFETIHSHTGHDIGVIAQEIQKILPQAVAERENGYLGVNYEKIIPLLIESIKELSAKVKELENK